jgi:predicted glycoside hydrolase/deacetylase ChbG (UPF0249 family)
MKQESEGAIQTRLVFHADDLGMNAAVDDGIFDCFDRGVLTSTAVLANGPTAASALARMRQLNDSFFGRDSTRSRLRERLGDPGTRFDVGVHLNLVQGRPLTGARYPSELLDEDGCFVEMGALFRKLIVKSRRWRVQIEAELSGQVAWVVDHGITPTHVNGHRYVELIPGVTEAIIALLPRFSISTLRVPLERSLAQTTLPTRGAAAWALALVKQAFAERFVRRVDAAGLKHPDSYFGTAHAGHMSIDALRRRLACKPNERLIEVGVHPGASSLVGGHELMTDGWHDPLAALRPSERDLLCSDDLVNLLLKEGIGLSRLSTLTLL